MFYHLNLAGFVLKMDSIAQILVSVRLGHKCTHLVRAAVEFLKLGGHFSRLLVVSALFLSDR